MIDNKPFAMFFNASPRKGWNTHKMLEAAKAGAEEAGAVTELVNLYDIKFPGCKSCFDEAAKRAHRDAQFPIDLAAAHALGKRLVEKAKLHI